MAFVAVTVVVAGLPETTPRKLAFFGLFGLLWPLRDPRPSAIRHLRALTGGEWVRPPLCHTSSSPGSETADSAIGFEWQKTVCSSQGKTLPSPVTLITGEMGSAA